MSRGDAVSRPDPTELPEPLAGFERRGAPETLELSRVQSPAPSVLLARCERRLAGRLLARGVLVSPLVASGAVDIEDAYRALLDVLVLAPDPPHVTSFRVRESDANAVDVLWRLAMALEARCLVREEGDGWRVDFLFAGRRSALAFALAEGAGEVRGGLGLLREMLASRRDERLLIMARDLRGDSALVRPAVAVEFAEATGDELRRRPRQFGLGLSATTPSVPGAHWFVGRVDGRVVYRMACTVDAPALALLPGTLRDRLPGPLALTTDGSTEPRFRGLSIYPAALQWLSRWAAEHGIGTLVALIRADNAPSIRGALKAGFQQIGELPSSAR